MTLFIHCYNKGHEALQETALRILSDILTTHNSLLLPVATATDSTSVTPPAFQKPLLRAFAKGLKATSPQGVQAAAVTALAKLLLTNALSPTGPSVPPSINELNESSIDTLLQALVVSFFHPRTRDNLALRQALTYFLPVYCHSRVSNAQHMRKIAVPAVRAVMAAADDFYSLEAEEDSDGEIDESVGEKEVKALMTGVIGMLAEWTDERRIIGLGVDPSQPPGTTAAAAAAAAAATIKPADSLHLALARDVLQRVLGAGTSSAAPREERKYLLSLLGKLHIPSPPAVPSRASSRAPDGVDERASVTSNSLLNANANANAAEVSADGAELLQNVKDLLDQAMSSNVAGDAAGRNALVKVKNSVLKLLSMMQVDTNKLRRVAGKGKERDMPHIKEEDQDDGNMDLPEGDSRSVVRSSRGASPQDGGGDDEDDDGEDTIIANRRESNMTDVQSNAEEADAATDVTGDEE